MRLPPPVLTILAGIAQRGLTPHRSPLTRPRAAGAALVGVGSLALMGGAGLEFRRRSTTVDPFHPELASALVTTGPNALTRNPMYVGMAGLLLSHALLRGSTVALLPVGGFVAVIDRWQIRAEEPALAARFGNEYDDYRSRTPRWLDGRSLVASPD